MTQEVINVGVNADDGTGDSLYEAGQKINNNFTELFAKAAVKADIKFFGNNITSRLSNADIFVHPSGTGTVLFPGIRFNDNNIEVLNTNDDIKIRANGSGKVTIAGLGFSGTTISAPDSSSVNINENLIVDGDYTTSDGFAFSGAQTFATDMAFGNLTLGNGSIVDSSGAISFGDENLTTTGTINAGDNSQFGNLDLSDGLIVNFIGGSIDFGNENLSTTGTLSAATGSQFGNLDLLNGTINDSSGTISFGDENLSTSASSMAIGSTLTAGSGSITDSTGAISFGDENVSTTGTLDVSGTSQFGSLSVSGATSFADSITVDNLTFNDNIISTSSNADLRLTPGGTGVVNVSNLTIDSSLNFSDNVLKVTTSNADFDLVASGSGSVVINNVNLDAGTIDNTVIGANEPAAGNFTQPIGYDTLVIPDKITFSGNTMSTNRSNDNLEFEASGSGKVVVNGLSLPNSDGQTGEFIQTDGSGNLTFAGVSISFSESTIQDAQATIGFTSEVVLDANLSTGENESITADTSMINDWASSKYDSAFYVALSRVEEADSSIEFQMQKHILARGTNDGSTFDSFSGSSQIIRTSAAEEVQLSTDIRAATDKVRLLGAGGKLADGSTNSTINTLHFFRIGLGDNDSSGTQAGSSTFTQQQTLVVADLDSAAANLDTFSASSYRGAKYFISVNNTTSNEVSSSEVLVVHNGTDAFISEYNLIISNAETTPLATFTADISGGNVRLRGANGTTGTCRVTMYRILLSDSEVDRSGTPIAIVGSTPIGQITTTEVDHVTATIDSRQGFETEETLDEFASSKYDSAWYHTLVKDMTSGRLAFHKYSLLHGTSDDSSIEAFVTDSSVVRSEEFDVVTANASVDDGNIRLNLTGINDGSTTISNFVNTYRLGLGDSDSTGYVGEESSLATVEINTDVDSASESIDSFAHADHRGAKYYVSVKNASGGEVMNIELLVVHNGTDAFITSYNEHSSGNTGAASTNTLCTFTAAIDGSNVVVSAAGLQTNLRIHMYRILLADNQSASTGTNVNVINAKTISSSATLIDSFNTSTYGAAHYIIIGTKSNDSCIMEATVISDGTNASISEGPQVSTEETPMLDLTVNQVSATAVVQASATSGGSTTVNAYRIHIPVPAGTQYTEIDSFAHNSTQGAMYIAVTNQTDGKSAIDEFMVVTDGTDAYNLRYGINTDSATSDLVNWTTAVEGSNAKVRASLADTRAQGTINAWQVHLDRAAGNPSNISTLDTFNKTTHRGAFYTVSISDSNAGALGNYELVDVRVTHDGTTPFISVFGRTNSASDDLVTFSADIDGDNVRLRGQISTSNTHVVTSVRRLIDV
jgi:ribosomal protein S16